MDKILDKHPKVFKEEPGKIRVQDKIKRYTPIKVRPNPIPLAKQAAVETELKRMLNLSVIERSNSSFSIPIVPVFKKNRKVWLCLDM